MTDGRAASAPGTAGGSAVPPPAPPPARLEAVQRWRLVLAVAARPGGERGPDPWPAALLASGLPVAGRETEPPRIRATVAAPLPAVAAGEAELLDVLLVRRLERWRVREALEAALPPGTRLVDLHDAWLGEPSLPALVAASAWRAAVRPAPAVPLSVLAAAAAALLAAPAIPWERARAGGGTRDLRPFLEDLAVEEDGGGFRVRLVLAHDPARGAGRPDEVLGALGARAGTTLAVDALVRERILLRDPARR